MTQATAPQPNAQPRNRAAAAPRPPQQMPGLEDHTPSRVIHEYDVPLSFKADDEDWRIPVGDATTADYGTIQTVCMKLLTPLEEKRAVARAKGDSLQMAYELAMLSVDGVISSEGTRSTVRDHDGSTLALWAQMHPKIRTLVMQAYADCAQPAAKATNSFLASRRIRA